MSSPLPELNGPQAEAVAHVNGPLLVFAGAGSGKTRVITYRVANLVAEHRVPAYRILAVTFTNKAAGEMRSRLSHLFVDSLGAQGADLANELWAFTFHATCARLLRRFGGAVGLPKDFVIYDTQDQKALVTRVLDELGLDDRRYPPRAVLHRIHKEKQEGRGPKDLDPESYVDEAVVKVFAKYEERLRAAGAVDFEDLIGLTVKIAESTELPEGNTLRRRFDYVLVDEFQDTNQMQYRLIRALAQTRNLCVVGDDDQSIYRWRGADVRNIRGFKKDFPDALVVKLEQNYRSSQRIVRGALGVIQPSMEREPKELWTDNDEGLPIEVVAVRDEHDEAALVTKVIRETQAEGTSLGEVAVFYRVHAQSRVLEEALRVANLPYQIVGGTKFYERAEIKDALSYLRILVNPRSDVDFLRIVNTPPRGIGKSTVDRLVAFANTLGVPVHDALPRIVEAKEIGTAGQKKLAGLRELLVRLGRDVETASPSEVLLDVIEKTGYREALRGENSAEADARLENLSELVGSLHDYEQEATAAGEKPTVSGFLERVSLQADVDGMKDEPRVTLMTVHGAKGLEFHTVCLTGMEEEMFPYRGMDPGGAEEMEEERRLAYVAITRARKRLVLSHAGARQIFGQTRWGRPSRFIGDLPEDVVVEKRTAAAGSQSPSRFVDRDDGWGRSAALPWKLNRPSPSSPPPSAPPPSRVAWGMTDGKREGGENLSLFGGPIPMPTQRAARPASEAREPGERYVDREFFDDTGEDAAASFRKGSRVFHERFGDGEVLRLVNMGEPAVVAFFPGWGEKKVLARFLKRG